MSETYTPCEGDVVRYRSERDNDWCREGMAIATKRSWDTSVVLIDTYWGTTSVDDHALTETEVDTAELLFNLADYDEVGRSRKAPPDEWQRRAEADRQVITQQHRLQNRWFIRKGSTEDRATIIDNARQRLEDAESELESARRRVEWAREDLVRAENGSTVTAPIISPTSCIYSATTPKSAKEHHEHRYSNRSASA
jgi:hypothetical protein